jgi:hypothetical protein
MFYTFIGLSVSAITQLDCCKSLFTGIPRGPRRGHLPLYRQRIDIHLRRVRDSKIIEDINTVITEDNHL